MMKTVQNRVIWHVEHLRLLHMPYLRFLSSFQKLMMKTAQKRVFRHDEQLRMLRMPLFAFMMQFSKIDDENSAKPRYLAC